MGKSVAVIGAGLCGMGCARQFADKGWAVTVFDKGRALGGRLATRESKGFAFDHGAPIVQAERVPFQTLMQNLVKAGSAARYDLALGDPRTNDEAPAYVGLPTMNRLLAPLADGLNVRQSHEVTALVEGAAGWTVALKDKAPATGFDWVVVAIPAPQASDLTRAVAGIDFVETSRIYEPVLTAMLALPHGLQPSALLRAPHPDIAYAIRNDAKPGRPADAAQWVLHATAEWSATHLEWDRPDIGTALARSFLEALDLGSVSPLFSNGHRWRFARVQEPINAPHIVSLHNKIAVTGDYFRGANAEYAFENGVATAHTILNG